MKDTTKQVLILNNLNSPEIQQAIIILRHPNPQNETVIIREAEQIIEQYLARHQQRKDKPTNIILAAVTLLGVAMTALAVYGGVQLINNIL